MPESSIILLHQADNVGVVIREMLDKGDDVVLDGRMFQANDQVMFGHKIAIATITQGEVIRKYGVPIGLATINISPGDHVHGHNMKSQYMRQSAN